MENWGRNSHCVTPTDNNKFAVFFRDFKNFLFVFTKSCILDMIYLNLDKKMDFIYNEPIVLMTFWLVYISAK